MAMETIFVVDDSDTYLFSTKRAMEEHYRVFTLPSASSMFKFLEKITPDLILLDIEMPEMDGFTAFEKLLENEETAKIPVIFLTATEDTDVETRVFEMGAVDFITKPFSQPVLLGRIANHLHINQLIKKRTKHIERLRNSVISVLADMVENRNEVTGGHIERTTAYIKILMDEMRAKGVYADEMHKWNFDIVVHSARLHDVGKAMIPDAILNKPGKLTDEEFEIIKTHVIEGEKIIDRIIARMDEDKFLIHAKMFVAHHHEYWNGLGYPRGLKGEDISLQGRIMALVDVYDALISERPYKKAFTHEAAVDIIMKDSGKHFDPKITEVFFDIKDKFKNMSQDISKFLTC
jgi:putative two-component system response regulator